MPSDSDKVHIPEVIEPEESLPADLRALRRFAFLMDEAFVVPGTNFRFGADAIIGLIPGVGDVIGGVLSGWVIVGALRHRVPAWIIVRMIWNVLVDLVFGAVPVAGDLFDFLWEENMRNMRLLEKYRNRRRPPRSTGEIALIAFVIIAFIVGFAIALFAAIIIAITWMMRS